MGRSQYNPSQIPPGYVDEIEASIGGEALVFGEVQHHWRPVDAHPDVLDAVCIRLTSLICILYD
jgi:hypothetical protein